MTEPIWTEQLGRDVHIRPGTSDRQTWVDTFEHGYHLPPGDMPTPGTVLDLGANIGLTAAHYCALWPDATVLAVEMDPESCALARLNAPCPVLSAAVTDTTGVGWYQTHDVEPEAYALAQQREDGYQPAALLPLYTITASLPGGRANFVKMDVEGAEWQLLKRGGGWWAARIGAILVELHGPRGQDTALVQQAVDLLRGLGYAAERHKPHPRAVYACRP